MSLAHIRKALEDQLATVSPAIAIVHENEPYTPVVGTPYAQCFVLVAQPDNVEIGPDYFERGIFQCSLFYPKDKGAGSAVAQAELIRAAFPFAASLTESGTIVNIIATPEIGPARPDEDRFMVPVKVRWRSWIGG